MEASRHKFTAQHDSEVKGYWAVNPEEQVAFSPPVVLKAGDQCELTVGDESSVKVSRNGEVIEERRLN